MLDADADKLVSKLLAGDLSATEEAELRERIEADPTARAALERMQATLAALQAWPATLPTVRVPARRRARPRRWLMLAPLAAAAALLLAVQSWFQQANVNDQHLPPPPGGHAGGMRLGKPPVSPEWAEQEFAFLKQVKPGGMRGGGPSGGDGGGKGKQGGDKTFGNPPGSVDKEDPKGGKTKGTDGGTEGGPGGGTTGGGTIGGGGKGGGPNPFRQLVDFDFDLPRQLPGDYQLKGGKAVAKNVLRLEYAARQQPLVIYLRASQGPDAGVVPLQQGRILAARQAGLALAVEGADLDFALVEAILKLLVPVPKPADPGLE